MKKRTIATVAILVGYLILFGVSLSGVQKDSVAIWVVGLGFTAGLILLATHKGLDNWLEGLDDEKKDDPLF